MTRFRERLLCRYRGLRHALAQRRGLTRESFISGVFNSGSSRRALLIYMTEPFLDGRIATDTRHQNRGQAVELAGALAQRGFRVDVAAMGTTSIPDRNPYDLVVDLHPGVTVYPSTTATIRIAYVTGSNPAFSNAEEQQRLVDLARRRGVKLRPRRQVPEFSPQALGLCSAFWFIGSANNLATFGNLPLPPVSYVRNFAYPTPRVNNRGRDPRHFVFLASGGQVHKGLDRLLEIFARRRDWTLHVCSNFHEEADFCDAFRHELFGRTNIIPHGFQRLDSQPFSAIAAAGTFMVLPSCSEANAGSVLSAMAAGLVPVVSRACGFEPEEVEYFPDCSIEEIERTLATQSARSTDDLANASDRVREIVESRYSPAAYAASINSAFDMLLDHHNIDSTQRAR